MRRMERADVVDALGEVEGRKDVLCYVCGVPTMTDEIVGFVKGLEGVRVENVLCERWW